MFRKTVPRKKSKRLFSKTAAKVNRKNGPHAMMRGGYRL